MGAKIVLSNSDPKNNDLNDNFFDELYKNYNILRVSANKGIAYLQLRGNRYDKEW